MMTYICMPKSLIHGWAMKTYANQPYSSREPVNLFIRELSPTFTPAVSRICWLLDSWNPFDNSIPEVLKLTSLPNTIEHFFLEETGPPHPLTRRIQDKRNPSCKGQSSQDKGQLLPQTVFSHDQSLKDTYGHPVASCEFMAKLLIANESLQKVDQKVKW